MPKIKGVRFLTINLDLLKPQSNPEKLIARFIRWLLSSGRYILIFVEALVLIVFISRFKLDGDLAAKKDAIAQQLPYIESLKPVEILIRRTQLKLSAIASFRSGYLDYPSILQKIAREVPGGVRIISLNLGKSGGVVSIGLNAEADSNSALALFLDGLREDQTFQNVTVTSIGLEKGSLNFSLSAQANPI